MAVRLRPTAMSRPRHWWRFRCAGGRPNRLDRSDGRAAAGLSVGGVFRGSGSPPESGFVSAVLCHSTVPLCIEPNGRGLVQCSLSRVLCCLVLYIAGCLSCPMSRILSTLFDPALLCRANYAIRSPCNMSDKPFPTRLLSKLGGVCRRAAVVLR